jgi:hypothetical protein
MDTSTITGLFTLSGAVAGGLLGMAGKTISDFMQAQRDREGRREQQRSDFQRWQREQVVLLMTNSAKAATLFTAKAVGKDRVTRQSDAGIQETSAELQGSLIALATVYPDTDSDEYQEFSKYLDEALWSAVPDDDPVWHIRQLLVKLGTRFGPSSFPSVVDESKPGRPSSQGGAVGTALTMI